MIPQPTTDEITTSIRAQLDGSLPKAFTDVISKVLAAVIVILFKYCNFIMQQLFVRTASADPTTINGTVVNPLEFWAQLAGISARTAATRAQLTVDITVENQVGSLPAQTQLLNADGLVYLTQAEVALNAATVQATVTCQTAGVAGNVDVGGTLSFANPLANVASDTTVATVVVQASDEETVATFRQRTLDAFQRPPQGGSYSDYRIWAEGASASVINAYPYTGDPGEVDVYIEVNDQTDGIPTTSQLATVQTAVDAVRPVNAVVNVLPISRIEYRITVSGLSVSNASAVQTQITDALNAYFADREPFLLGLSVPPRRDRVTSAETGGVIAQIVALAGGTFTGHVLELSGAPLTFSSVGIGEKAKVVVTFA